MAVTIKINPCPERYNSANPYKTGQTTSYATGDDGDLERGRGSDFTTLEFNNPFGNTNRFTDTLGGQTYGNDIVIDWSTTNYIAETVLGWYRLPTNSNVQWANAITAAEAATYSGYTDWHLPNYRELVSITNMEVGSGLNYSPFSISGSNCNNGLWTSTTQPSNTNNALGYVLAGLIVGGLGSKTNNVDYIPVRTFTFTELGL